MSPPPWVVGALVVAAVVLCSCALGPPIFRNVYEVVPDKVLRSAQLSPERLSRLIAKHRIRSVLNLRGPSVGIEWYDQERAVCSKSRVEHIDFELSSAREVPVDQAHQLIALMKNAPKPMLIHCWAGADRTGLASALYLYAIADQKERADSALSVRYFHLPFTSAGAMDRSFEAFVQSDRATAATLVLE